MVNQKKTIILVDDEISIVNIISRSLKKYNSNLFIDSFDDPEEAFNYINNTEKIDLLITDVKMPKLNGLQLYQRIAEKHNNLPTIFMSGYTEDHAKIQELINNKDIIRYINKPFSISKLNGLISELI